MKTLVLANQKGGVGKSAVATLLAHHLRRLGQRVLAIDLDHQANFSQALTRSGRAVVAEVTADRLLAQAGVGVPDAPFVLVSGHRELLALERQAAQHNAYARNVRAFLAAVDGVFDVAIVDTNPNPDIRVIAALASADFVVSPVQLNQEAMSGVNMLLNHERVGIRRIKAVLNPKLQLVGLLPTMVEPTPFQKANYVQVVQAFHPILIRVGDGPGAFAAIPRRSCIAEAQASGEVLWEMKKTAAREASAEIRPTLDAIAARVMGAAIQPAEGAPHAAAA
ncbi:ParA family protein [Methylibium sp. Root1272]|uniref:ParA family protein n=1 Tax=Methylibium sp. Root1272 TaxID=1736441 RepID=UPI0006F76340|nr:ParA family protein [Methylibium sp. Root1272]KQW69833.1 chromosome partitioning protein [Methylibium sp. Root1272]